MQTPEKIPAASSPVKSPLSGNPLAFDDDLQDLVTKLDSITNRRGFRKWKGSFLRRFESFLAENGIGAAEDSYNTFAKKMELFEKNVVKVKKLCSEGAISIERVSVKGRNSLNELTTQLKTLKDDMQDLIPSTGALEKQKGYTKYHMGIALVRDGFASFDRMVRLEEMLQGMTESEPLSIVADKQQLLTVTHFSNQLTIFKDVINDLGLLEVAMKCRDFIGEDEDIVVLLDPKTGATIELSRSEFFSSTNAQEESNQVEKEELLSRIQEVFLA